MGGWGGRGMKRNRKQITNSIFVLLFLRFYLILLFETMLKGRFRYFFCSEKGLQSFSFSQRYLIAKFEIQVSPHFASKRSETEAKMSEAK